MKKALYVFICAMTILGLLIQAIELVAFDRSIYKSEYEKFEIYEYIGISEADLMEVTDVLLSYMEQKRPDMNVEATINNQRREVFNEREKAHMVDVNKLISLGVNFKWFSFGAFTLMVIYLLKKEKGQAFKTISDALIIGLLIDFIICGVIVAYASYDFDSFWTSFHLVFFSNDLWQLDPYTDVMIMMFPLAFFRDMVIRVITYYVIELVVVGAISLAGRKSNLNSLV